jgi:ABC-2 type transport system permease protein
MKIFLSMVIRELKAVRKEKTILFAILIQLFIASCSSILVVGLMSFYEPDSIGTNTNVRIKVGVISEDNGLFMSFLGTPNIRVKEFDDADKAEAAFLSGTIDSIVYVPKRTSGVVNMKLVLPDMDARATIVLMVLKNPLKEYENFLREQQGVHMRYGDIGGKTNSTYEFLYTIIIPVLMFFPAFIAGSMVVDSVSEEMENKTLATLLSTPVTLISIFSAKIVASIIIAIVQCFLWALLLRANSFSIQNLGIVLFFSMVISAIIALTALMVSMLFRDRERSQFIYSMVIVVIVGISFFLNPSPFGIIARLATGDTFLNIGQIFVYLLLLLLLSIAFPLLSRKVVSKVV